MICQNCQREFTATKHSRVCTYCNFDNGLSRFASSEHVSAMEETQTPFKFRHLQPTNEELEARRIENEHPQGIDFSLDHDEPSELEG